MVKCHICGAKAKRTCQIKGGVEICPLCCATTRSRECANCSFYTTAQKYKQEKQIKSGKRDFYMEIKPELEKRIDDALALIEKGRYALAESLLDKVAESDPGYYQLEFARGTLHALKKEYDEAILCFNKATDKFPYFMEAHFNKGAAYQEKADIPNMVRSYRKVLETGDPDDEIVRKTRTFLRNFEQSVQETDTVDLDTYLAAYDAFDRGITCMTRLDWKNAIVEFERCTCLIPRSPKGYANIGLCKAKLGKMEEAIAALDKAIELDPKYEPALINRAAISSGIKIPEGQIPMVEYAKDYQVKKKSLIKEVLDTVGKLYTR